MKPAAGRGEGGSRRAPKRRAGRGVGGRVRCGPGSEWAGGWGVRQAMSGSLAPPSQGWPQLSTLGRSRHECWVHQRVVAMRLPAGKAAQCWREGCRRGRILIGPYPAPPCIFLSIGHPVAS